MQTVFNNEMVAHVWAQQTQEIGRSNNGNFYFEGKTIYSYGAHFPIATFLNGCVLVTEKSYSVSTAKHVSYVWRALDSSIKKIYIPNWKDGFFGASIELDKKTHKKNWQWFKDELQETLNKASHARSNRELLLRKAHVILAKMKDYKSFFKLSWVLPEIESVDLDALNAKLKEQAKKKAKQKERKNKQRIKEWYAGERMSLHDIKTIFLRVSGDKVQTSRGAEFPVDHAKLAFKMIKRCHDKKESWQTNEHTIHLGHFKIETISENGDVKAGCHFVKWPEIERCAKQLNII